MNLDLKNRISGFFDNNGFNPLRPKEKTPYDQGGINIVQVHTTSGKKIPLGVEALGASHDVQDFKPIFKITDKQKDFFALTNLKTQDQKEYFLIGLLKENNPGALERDDKLSSYFQKLEQKITMSDALKISNLADFYAENLQDTDQSLDNFYDELHAIAVNSSDEELSAKLRSLIEEREERASLNTDAFELTDVSVNANRASNMKLETELSPKLIAEFMGLCSREELDLFNQLRSFYNTNYLNKLAGLQERKPQEVPALVDLANSLNDTNQANYINNLAKRASDLERDDQPTFEKYGPRLLKIAATFGKGELANRIFDILPNIFLKQEN